MVSTKIQKNKSVKKSTTKAKEEKTLNKDEVIEKSNQLDNKDQTQQQSPSESNTVNESVIHDSTTPSNTDSPLTNDESSTDLSENFKQVCNGLTSLVVTLKTLTLDVKKLEKRVTKELKEAKKSRKVKKVSNLDKPKRAPSGFAKPSDISEELCQFLGRPLGTQMARTEVTKHVTQYIKDHGLQNPENKRHILPDKKLSCLLGAGSEEEVTYFNLQKYMKHHFPKSLAQLKEQQQ